MEAGDFAKKNQAHLYQTSAKEGTGVQELFKNVADKCYEVQLGQGYSQLDEEQRIQV